jgi:carbon-monoxide dehydrogenase small subunit
MTPLSLTVNGRPLETTFSGSETLHQVLRRLQLFSVREACGLGICGSCTVEMDGVLVSSCLVLAGAAEGATVETLEALNANGRLDPIQEAFVEHSGFQCSFCTPGFVLATRALLAENPDPTREQVRVYLAGNLCRCGSYLKIEDAVLSAAGRRAGD